MTTLRHLAARGLIIIRLLLLWLAYALRGLAWTVKTTAGRVDRASLRLDRLRNRWRR